jgi:hypothetical protein
MITKNEFKQLANDTGLSYWKEVEEENSYISYPLPLFNENLIDPYQIKLHSAIISYAPGEIFVYDKLIHEKDYAETLIQKREIYQYNLVSSIFEDDGTKWHNSSYEELRDKILKVKQMLFNEQQQINLDKIKGDFQ